MNEQSAAAYRVFRRAMAVVFAIVGAIFLTIPEGMLTFFNDASRSLGMVEGPVERSFFGVLAAAYMYVVTALAWLMARSPNQKIYPWLLAQASIEGLSLKAARRAYAEFSQRAAEKALARPESLEEVEKRLFDERHISLLFPAMKVRKTRAGMVLVCGMGAGGTTTMAAANALRLDQGLKAIGVDLNEQFAQLDREVPLSTAHRGRWNDTTERLFSIFEDVGLAPKPLPKMRRRASCSNCGRCVLGCPSGAKWDSREFLEVAAQRGARLITGCRVEKVVIENDRAAGVSARVGSRRKFFAADVVVLAAGGLGSPVILQNSGIGCQAGLFVDPVLCVAAPWNSALHCREIPMPFTAERGSCMLSPYFDYLSYFFNRDWRPQAGNILSLMIKLADASSGTVTDRAVEKDLTPQDSESLADAVQTCVDILRRLGIDRSAVFLGTLNAGHPGGMLPLTAEDARTLRPGSLPGNLFLADATLLPQSLGKPPILTIMALAKKIAQTIKAEFGGGGCAAATPGRG